MQMVPAPPRRSLLYIPASNARAMEKAAALDADGFIIDLENAVLPEAKRDARSAAVGLVRSGALAHREVIVRVNALDTDFAHDDLASLAEAGARAVLLPKVSTPDDIRAAAGMLGSATQLWAMMETTRSILYAREIASVGAPLAGFVVGTNDLAKELRCAHPADRAPMMTALQMCVLAARANDLAVIDGVHIDLNDDAGFVTSCRESRALGFDGRSLIHPKQIPSANEAYAPTPEEITRAHRIVDAHREAAAAGKGVTVVDGRLVEFLHVREAERVIVQADAIAALRSV